MKIFRGLRGGATHLGLANVVVRPTARRMKRYPWRKVAAVLSIWSGAAAIVAAAPLPVYFGTGGPGAKGIYRATFDPANGKLTVAELAAEVGSPGFLALHPAGDKLYAVANFPGGPGAIGYKIGAGGALRRCAWP